MRERNKFLLCTVSIATLVVIHLITSSNLLTIESRYNDSFDDYDVGNLVAKPSDRKFNKEKLAVIVPFRDCFEELLVFAPHLQKFLNAQEIPHHIFIINQVDQYRFNRGSLINVGFLYTRKSFEYFVIHDVDLLPLNKNLSYGFPTRGVFHVASHELHPKKKYDSYLGGIVVASNKDFKMVNGMSNDYWGWGLEDDEFSINLRIFGIQVDRPKGIKTGKNGTFIDIHKGRRIRDKAKCRNQTKQTLCREMFAGLARTKFKIKSIKDHKINDAAITILNVELNCNKTRTPWCEC